MKCFIEDYEMAGFLAFMILACFELTVVFFAIDLLRLIGYLIGVLL